MTINNRMLAGLVLVLAMLACSKADASLTPAVLAGPTDEFPIPAVTSPAATDAIGVRVVITADLVNIRAADGSSQGITASRGTELVLRVSAGEGFATIISPAKWNGMKVWIGCTSEPGEFGCEASQ